MLNFISKDKQKGIYLRVLRGLNIHEGHEGIQLWDRGNLISVYLRALRGLISDPKSAIEKTGI
ncbi:MAG: hypothetical protein DRI57_12140 [Deltaproteobacteria bacterium]|nr:MAG: hypothetical protein DRI57_12140 [Deltaproteobacteria bacterium]